jgi:hypothetical protein
MSDLPDDPERRLTLRQATQARNGFAMILDEIEPLQGQACGNTCISVADVCHVRTGCAWDE